MHSSSINIAPGSKKRVPLQADQTNDAVNEAQTIVAQYEVFNEEQELTFESWPNNSAAVKEVQEVTVSSSCASHLCGNTFFSLGYGDTKTGPIAVSASAAEVQASLNHLWSIKPDKVQVTKQDNTFTVTFDSDRGDFKPLHYEVFGSDTNITVAEVTKGKSNMETFTLLWGGIPTKPITFNATGSEVQSALEDMMKGECPKEILTTEGTDVKYFKDFENDNSQFDTAAEGTPVKNVAFCGLWSLKNAGVLFKNSYTKESGGNYGSVTLAKHPTLCFAYKGMLKDEVGLKFTYSDSQGETKTETAKIATLFNKGDKWSYKCMDMESSLQNDYIGGKYTLLEVYLYKDASGADFYVDAIHIGESATAMEENAVPNKRRPPPFESSGRSFEAIAVTSVISTALPISYRITATPIECAFDFPLLEVGFLQQQQLCCRQATVSLSACGVLWEGGGAHGSSLLQNNTSQKLPSQQAAGEAAGNSWEISRMESWMKAAGLLLAVWVLLLQFCPGRPKLDPSEYSTGNLVFMVSDTLSVPCDVEKDSTHGKQITCYTRLCGNRTPTIGSMTPVSGPSRSLHGRDACDFLKPNSDDLYGIKLNSDTSWHGWMSCKMTGTYVGHHNLSYILDNEFGRSLVGKNLFRVSTLDKLSMFQTYAEVTGVSPSDGSVMGGTVVTIHGRNFDQTDAPARVLLGGNPTSDNFSYFVFTQYKVFKT
ncbi:fibrocystin-L-like [Pseudochaenichthys georgianus]|uniref:fibrocystin-L-like n=1 Tax=Pseudochaenichthys georgianus TaxID=52239 RepID=UPI0039C159E5